VGWLFDTTTGLEHVDEKQSPQDDQNSYQDENEQQD